MRAALVAALAFASALPPPATAADPFPSDGTIREILRQRVESGNGVGIVVGLLDEKGTRRIVAYGRQDREGGAEVDGDTRFEIGSITKVFTGTLLADMVVRGVVQLDDPIREYLPPTVKLPMMAGHDITLVQLATHASGLPRIPANLRARDYENPYADYTVEDLYADLGTLPDVAEVPGEEARYSNLGFGLLGHVLARRAGKDYGTLLQERVLGPLGMRSTSLPPAAGEGGKFAWPHYASLARAKPWDIPTLAGAGALRSTARDLLEFAAANMDAGPGPLRDALRLQRNPVEPRHALAWLVRGYVVAHNGATAGSVSFIAIDTREKRAVVVLANSANSASDIGNHLLDPSVPLQEPRRREVPREVALADPKAFDELVGTYRLAPAFAIDVSREGDRYYIQATGQRRAEIFPSAPDVYFLKVVEAKITFVRDAAGHVTHLLLDQNQRVQRGNRVTP